MTTAISSFDDELDIDGMTLDEIVRHFHEVASSYLTITERAFVVMSRLFIAARAKGHTIPLNGYAVWIAEIATGRVSAKAAATFAIQKPRVLMKIAGMPISEQDRLADGADVEVVDTASRRPIRKPIADMDQSELSRAIKRDGKGTPFVAPLKDQFRQPVQPKRAEPRPVPRVDGDLFIAGNTKCLLADARAALAAVAGPDKQPAKDLPSEWATLTGRWLPDEAAAIKEQCAEEGTDVMDVMRLAMRAYGYPRKRALGKRKERS